jgi:hypothetical protein
MAELDAPGAGQEAKSCKQQSSTRAAGALAADIALSPREPLLVDGDPELLRHFVDVGDIQNCLGDV